MPETCLNMLATCLQHACDKGHNGGELNREPVDGGRRGKDGSLQAVVRSGSLGQGLSRVGCRGGEGQGDMAVQKSCHCRGVLQASRTPLGGRNRGPGLLFSTIDKLRP